MAAAKKVTNIKEKAKEKAKSNEADKEDAPDMKVPPYAIPQFVNQRVYENIIYLPVIFEGLKEMNKNLEAILKAIQE